MALKPCRIEIIDHPRFKTHMGNMIDWVLTLFFWGMWFYFLMPLLTTLLWIAGIKIFYAEVVANKSYIIFGELLKSMGLIVGSVITLLGAWQYYNLWRFGKLNRRRKSIEVQQEKVASYFGISLEMLNRFQQTQNLTITVTGEGEKIKILAVNIPNSSTASTQ